MNKGYCEKCNSLVEYIEKKLMIVLKSTEKSINS